MPRFFEASPRRVQGRDLARLDLFDGIDAAELEKLAESFLEAVIAPQQVVLEAGERADAFFIVSEGALAAYSGSTGEPVQLQARLHRDDFFGEFGLVSDAGRYAASIRASEPSRVLRIDRDAFTSFMERHPGIQLKLQMVAARRYSNALGTALELGRRREVRIRCSHDVEVELSDGIRRRVRLENLSLGGLCLDGAPQEWQRGASVRFGLVLREGLLPLEGTVQWRRRDSVGVAFDARSPDHDRVLQIAIRLLLESGS